MLDYAPKPKLARIEDPIAEDYWEYIELGDWKTRISHLAVGRPTYHSRKWDWYCPVRIQGHIPEIDLFFGCESIDALMNAMMVLRRFFEQCADVFPRAKRPPGLTARATSSPMYTGAEGFERPPPDPLKSFECMRAFNAGSDAMETFCQSLPNKTRTQRVIRAAFWSVCHGTKAECLKYCRLYLGAPKAPPIEVITAPDDAWRPKLTRIEDPIANDHWRYVTQQGRRRLSQLTVGRPTQCVEARAWYCPVLIGGFTDPAIKPVFGEGPVDALMNAMTLVKKFSDENFDILPGENPKVGKRYTRLRRSSRTR